ncbi:MAG: TorF family putative porin [Ignavibacteriaceae bacterium]
MKFTLFLLSLFLLNYFPVAYTQEESESPLSVMAEVDIVSRYIWRGVEWGGASPSIQPAFYITYDMNRFGQLEFGAWGAYMVNGSYTENDLSLKYSLPVENYGVYSLSLTDYLYPYLDIPINNFEGEGNGAHTLDISFEYEGPEKFPVSLLVSQLVFNDYPDYKSLYLEVGYSFAISEMENKIFLGAARGISDWNSITTDKFEFSNIGYEITKEIPLSENYSASAAVAFILNWHQKTSFVVFKLTL